MNFPWTDWERALVMVYFADKTTFYIPELDKYRSFRHGRWIDEEKDTVELRLYYQMLQRCCDIASREPNTEEFHKKIAVIHSASGARRIADTRRLFRSFPQMQISVKEFDQHQDILPCTNCTYDLRLNTTYPTYKCDLQSRILGTSYDPQADCPKWRQFIKTVTAEDDAMVTFIQMVVGYLLCGGNPLQKMFIVYGPRGTGKTTFVLILQHLFGSLARKTAMATFADKTPIRNALAALKGTRVVIVDENDSEESGHLNSALLKQVVGAENVEARYLYKEFFEFTVTFKLIIATNYLPAFKVFDEALARRIVPIPFFNKIASTSVDATLSEKLIDELPGILNWALRGWDLVQSRGLNLPFRVQQLLHEYTLNYNSVARFIHAACENNAGSRTRSIDLYRLYRAYCKAHGEGTPMKHKSFVMRIEDSGFPTIKYRGTKQIEGIRIRDRFYLAADWAVLPEDTH